MLFHYHRNKWTQSWCLKPRQMYYLMVLQVTGLTQLLLEWNQSVKGCVPPGGSRGGCTCSPFPPSRGSPSCLGPGPFPYQSPPVMFSHAWLWHSFADAALLTHSFWWHWASGSPRVTCVTITSSGWPFPMYGDSPGLWRLTCGHWGAMTKKVFSFNSSRTLIVWDLSKSTASSAGLRINQLSLN